MLFRFCNVFFLKFIILLNCFVIKLIFYFIYIGFIISEEVLLYEKVDCKYNKFWVLFMWVNVVLVYVRKEDYIKIDWGL